MKVVVRNKILSIGGSSVVEDENGNDIYRVKGKVFSPTRKKTIYDMEGNKLFEVRNKFWKFITQRAFIKDCSTNERLATVKYGVWTTNGRYVVEDYKDEIEIVGKRFSLSREVKKNGETMANITSEFLKVADNFTIDANEEDIPFLSALVIAIDNIKDKEKKDND